MLWPYCWKLTAVVPVAMASLSSVLVRWVHTAGVTWSPWLPWQIKRNDIKVIRRFKVSSVSVHTKNNAMNTIKIGHKSLCVTYTHESKSQTPGGISVPRWRWAQESRKRSVFRTSLGLWVWQLRVRASSCHRLQGEWAHWGVSLIC